MSSGDRDPDYSSLLIALLCLLVVVAGVVCINWLVEEKARYQQARDYTRHYEPTKASGICLKFPSVTIGCTQEVGSEEGTDDNGADLKAQQEMADWAYWMVLFTAIGITLSTVGVVLIYATFRATRAQLAEAAKQTMLDRLRSQALITAKVKGGVIHYFNKPEIKPTFDITLQNSGDTDAKDVVVEIEGWLHDERQEDVGFGKFSVKHSAGYIYRGTSHPYGIAAISEYVLPEQAIVAIQNATNFTPVRVKLSIMIKWTDAFEDRQSSGPFYITGQLLAGGSPRHVWFAAESH